MPIRNSHDWSGVDDDAQDIFFGKKKLIKTGTKTIKYPHPWSGETKKIRIDNWELVKDHDNDD